MRRSGTIYLLFLLFLMPGAGRVPAHWIVTDAVRSDTLPILNPGEITFSLTEEGFIPAWLVVGPFEQPTIGFGQAVDTDVIGEIEARPVAGNIEQTTIVEGGTVAWKPLHSAQNGFVDFNASMGWVLPGDGPEKVWKAKAGYAFTYIDSPNEQEVVLKVGSNSSIKVVLNGEAVHANTQDRNAEPDTDTVPLSLRAGRNSLLVKVGQTHRNEAPGFFSNIRFEWGFYARLLNAENMPAHGLDVVVGTGAEKTSADLESTFFFRETSEGLKQRFDLVVNSFSSEQQSGELIIRAGGMEHLAKLEQVPFGESRHSVYIPAVTVETPASVSVDLGNELLAWDAVLHPQPRYEIHLAMMSHTDIGYTNTQPVVKERHLRTLDDVLERFGQDSTFSWTIETVWQLEQYEQGRPREKFNRLMALVKEGRIAVSPVYTNPYTGWVSAEEMVRSFDKGHAYSTQHDLKLDAAIYNDVPGLSWLMPQVLEQAGIPFLATGINEVYSDYLMQRNLPKVFFWEGVGGGRVLTYRTEAYNEGQTLGLEKSIDAVPYRMWERLHRLQAQGYAYDMVLAVHTFGDNGGIPLNAPATTESWNAEYAYPRIQISNIAAFAKAFQARYGDLPVLTGDWTSTWDVLFQGEPARMVRQRWAQHHALTAEKMATLSWLLDQTHDPLSLTVDAAYDNLLHYSGHGSGLEYGYASPKDNLTTMAYREQYVQDAVLATEEVLERATFRLSAREESFEGEGLYVFNALNWTRDTPVEAEFPRENAHQYRAIDLDTGELIPSHYGGYTLRFVARDVPPIGYKKIRLERILQPDSLVGGDLRVGGCAIENAYYRIEGDCNAGQVTRIVDLKSGQELIDSEGDTPFGVPMRADSLFSPFYEPMDTEGAIMYVRDERPVRLALVTERDGHLFVQSEYTLWQDLDRVDVRHTMDLETLEFPEQMEDYSVAFPFALPNREATVEVLGGFLNVLEDRFPGVDHDAFSLRRSVAIHNEARTVSWAAVDSRVVRLREANAGEGIAIFANLVNNFPEAWNRWEENEGMLDFRFSLTSREGGFQPASTSRFGWEINTPPVVRYTWLRSSPAKESFVTVEGGRTVLLTLRPAGDENGVELRLMNMDPNASAEARIASPLFDIGNGMRVTMFGESGISFASRGDSALVTLAPGEIQTLRFGLPSR